MQQETRRAILVTGASKGIGAATARAFAAQGDRVALLARDAVALHALATELGGLPLPCDVADPAAMAAAVAQAEATFGPLDVLVNNAATITPIGRIADTDPQAWATSVTTNLSGTFFGIRAALPGMLARGSGTIITISSGAAHSPVEGWSSYCAGKAGAAMLMRSLHLEYAALGIRSVGLSPGTVATDMQRVIRASGVGPVAQLDWAAHIPAEWVGRAVVWLAGPDGAGFDGREASLRDPELRRLVGLTAG